MLMILWRQNSTPRSPGCYTLIHALMCQFLNSSTWSEQMWDLWIPRTFSYFVMEALSNTLLPYNQKVGKYIYTHSSCFLLCPLLL